MRSLIYKRGRIEQEMEHTEARRIIIARCCLVLSDTSRSPLGDHAGAMPHCCTRARCLRLYAITFKVITGLARDNWSNRMPEAVIRTRISFLKTRSQIMFQTGNMLFRRRENTPPHGLMCAATWRSLFRRRASSPFHPGHKYASDGGVAHA